MNNRSEIQTIFKPTANVGQRILIGAVSVVSAALPLRKKVLIWASKGCWIKIGASTVVALQPAGVSPLLTGGSFPIPVGATYEYEAQGSQSQYVAVIEDASESAVTGYLFIGQSEA